MANMLKVGVIGVGGIESAATAVEKIRAGADLIQVYTGFIYEGPRMVRNLARGLLAKLDQHQLGSISEAVGRDLA